MKKYSLVLFLLAFTATGYSQEIKISSKALPAAVIKSYRSAYPNTKIAGATKETGKDGVEYEIISKDSVGKRTTLTYSADGTLIETEEPMTIDQLPAPVTGAITKQYPKGKVMGIEMAMKGPNMTYEVLIKDNKKKFEVVYDMNGNVVPKK